MEPTKQAAALIPISHTATPFDGSVKTMDTAEML